MEASEARETVPFRIKTITQSEGDMTSDVEVKQKEEPHSTILPCCLNHF